MELVSKTKEQWNKLENFIWIIITGILALGITIFIYQLWKLDFLVPLCYCGDSCSSLSVAQNMIDGGWLYVYERIAPLGALYYSSAIGFVLHAAILWVICLFTDSAAIAVNIFYLLCFSLIAMTGFIALQSMKISKFSSMIGGILYSQLPYHYMRSEGHLWLSAYYIVPLACLVLYYIISGQLKEIKDRKTYFSIMIAFLLGCSDIYYSVFFLELCVCAVIICILESKKLKTVCSTMCILFSTGISLLLTLLPMLIHSFFTDAEVPLADRAHGDVDIFGLKWIYLILPIQNHRIPILAEFRKFCDVNFPNNNENGFVSLGLLLAVAFVISLIFVIVGVREKNILIYMGILSLVAIFLTGVGSISTLVSSLITTSIRSCNRISVYIAMFSTVSFCYLLDKGKSKLIAAGVKNSALIFFGVFILCFGVWDMTSSDYAIYSSYNGFEHEWDHSRKDEKLRADSDREFFGKIQNQMKKGEMVLQLPIVSDTIYSSFPNGIAGTWTNYYPYFYTDLKWSHGDIKGGENDKWLSRVKNIPIEQLIDVAVYVGFTGIYIDPLGYNENDLDNVVSIIRKKTGATALKSKVGNLYFYNIQNYAEELKKQYTEEEWRLKKNYWLYDFSGYYKGKYMAVDLNYFDSPTFNKNGSAVLKKENLQYGPYIQLSSGIYKIKIIGEGMRNAAIECTADFGESRIPIKILKKTNEEIVYCIKVKEDVENVEFITRNNSSDEVIIKTLSYESIYDEPIDYVNEYRPAELSYNKSQMFDEDGNAILSRGDMQFGPYTWLSSGVYEVTILGKGMKNAEVSCTADSGKQSIPVKATKITDTKIVYRVELEKDTENVEFLTKNNKSSTIKVRKLKYRVVSQK